MKSLLKISLSVCGLISTIWGGFVVFDNWVIKKANTVVEPIKTQVETMVTYDKALHESIEREMIHIRHYQKEQNDMLKRALYK